MKIKYFVLTILFGSGFALCHAQSESAYKIANKIHLDGDGSWDLMYSDDANGILYLSHGTIVQVLNESDGELVGTISGMDGVHGIAISPGMNKGYISSGNDNMVYVFNTRTLSVLKKIPVPGQKPDEIRFDPFSKQVFVFNGHSKSVSVIDVISDSITATIELGGKPELSVADGNGKVFVNFEAEGQICVINSATLKVENIWPLAPGVEPTGLAIDNSTHRLFSACANKTLVILDARSGKIITTLPIGEDPDGAAFDPERKCAFAPCKEGKLTIIQEKDANTFVIQDNLTTMYGAKTMAINMKTHHIYTSSADFEPRTGREKPKIVPGSFVVLDIMPE